MHLAFSPATPISLSWAVWLLLGPENGANGWFWCRWFVTASSVTMNSWSHQVLLRPVAHHTETHGAGAAPLVELMCQEDNSCFTFPSPQCILRGVRQFCFQIQLILGLKWITGKSVSYKRGAACANSGQQVLRTLKVPSRHLFILPVPRTVGMNSGQLCEIILGWSKHIPMKNTDSSAWALPTSKTLVVILGSSSQLRMSVKWLSLSEQCWFCCLVCQGLSIRRSRISWRVILELK